MSARRFKPSSCNMIWKAELTCQPGGARHPIGRDLPDGGAGALQEAHQQDLAPDAQQRHGRGRGAQR